MSESIGIVGYGGVGKAMSNLFKNAVIYDEFISDYNTNTIKKKAYNSDYIFICVPTPNKANGFLDCSVVEECVGECKNNSNIIIRSTINPKFTDYVQKNFPQKNITYQPEYLGETPDHPMLEIKGRNFIVLGGYNLKPIIDLYTTVYNANIRIEQVIPIEAEIIKLSENRAIMGKVMQCQELYDACQEQNINYYRIRDIVYGSDQRFNLGFTFVYPQNRGCNSKCIPKDVYAGNAGVESISIYNGPTKYLLDYNKNKYISTEE